MKTIYRLLRYLKGNPDQGLLFPSKGMKLLKAYADSDWVNVQRPEDLLQNIVCSLAMHWCPGKLKSIPLYLGHPQKLNIGHLLQQPVKYNGYFIC